MPKLSDDVFPETLWKAFGEHMGEEEEDRSIELSGQFCATLSLNAELLNKIIWPS